MKILMSNDIKLRKEKIKRFKVSIHDMREHILYRHGYLWCHKCKDYTEYYRNFYGFSACIKCKKNKRET